MPESGAEEEAGEGQAMQAAIVDVAAAMVTTLGAGEAQCRAGAAVLHQCLKTPGARCGEAPHLVSLSLQHWADLSGQIL